MQEALRELAAGRMPERQMDFAALRTLVGFDAYDRLLEAYAAPPERDHSTHTALHTAR
jgi:hypothetical protein